MKAINMRIFLSSGKNKIYLLVTLISILFMKANSQLEVYNDVEPTSLQLNTNDSIILVNEKVAYNWPVLSLSVFSIFGIFGNILVCLAIRRDHSLQTKTNYYLFSLAIADLAVCLYVIPLSIIQDFSGKLNCKWFDLMCIDLHQFINR